MTITEKTARRMMIDDALVIEAEKMLGKKWETMTQEERRLTAVMLSAFYKEEENEIRL